MSKVPDNPFSYLITENTKLVEKQEDDVFFEEAFAEHPHSAVGLNKYFIGSVIKTSKFSLGLFFAIFILIIFLFRTASWQIVNGEEFRTLAEDNRILHQILPSERGVIYDRNGRILADNIPTFQIITSINQLPTNTSERNEKILALATLINADPFTLFNIIDSTDTNSRQILLKSDLDYDTAMYIASNENKYQYIQLETGSKRHYITTQIPTLSHILGYIGTINIEEYQKNSSLGYRRFDNIGKQGLELEYEKKLRGTFGDKQMEINARGNVKRIISENKPINGKNLYLTLDASLQAYIETAIIKELKNTTASKVSIVVMDPNNGDILALTSWPSFDSNDFTSGIDSDIYSALLNDKNNPLFPRAVSGEFPSGSTIKPINAAAALIEGIITPTTTFLSTGGINVGPWFFPDWRAEGHGITNVYWAIADSVNTFFYIIGGGYDDFQGLGIDKLMEYSAMFGFGSTTGLDLPGEADGFLPSPEWKQNTKGEQWYIGDTYHAAIGQGDYLATPLQITRAISVFANNGFLVTPHLNSELEYPKTEPIISTEIAKIIKDAMRDTITIGSAQSLKSLPVEVAGKTGTAQWSTKKAPHSWFTGFAPLDNPEIVITVLVEEGGNDYLAVPIAKDIFTWWFSDR